MFLVGYPTNSSTTWPRRRVSLT